MVHLKTPPLKLKYTKRKSQPNNVPYPILLASVLLNNHLCKLYRRTLHHRKLPLCKLHLRNILSTVRLQQTQTISLAVLYSRTLKIFDLWRPHHLIQHQYTKICRLNWLPRSQLPGNCNLFPEQTRLRGWMDRHTAPQSQRFLST